MADERDIAMGINMLKIAFPNYQPDTRATAELWMHTLADLDAPLLKAAIMTCITERGRAFAPSIGEIRDAAVQILARGENLPQPAEALMEIIKMPPTMKKEVSLHLGAPGFPISDPIPTAFLPDAKQLKDAGYSHMILEQSVEWSHPLIGKVAQLMGWPKQFPSDNPTADRAQFFKVYGAEVERYLTQKIEHPELKAFSDGMPRLIPELRAELSKVKRALEINSKKENRDG